ncbi:hypothetical protein RchiOBHm_Chr7g0210571 [Rosa chinensis]|uniref:Uncharacterized protein n=1 Tax=Rosa chinensis TaxID=74649 RepID=A0A2P6PA96_ROSCH|nr:hypothetical protein RchiOBHm_Chr7g0210571 [Rosa chinensis]
MLTSPSDHDHNNSDPIRAASIACCRISRIQFKTFTSSPPRWSSYVEESHRQRRSWDEKLTFNTGPTLPTLLAGNLSASSLASSGSRLATPRSSGSIGFRWVLGIWDSGFH